jgi:hypothetical protein
MNDDHKGRISNILNQASVRVDIIHRLETEAAKEEQVL